MGAREKNISKAIIVSGEALDPSIGTEKMALFNPDGSPLEFTAEGVAIPGPEGPAGQDGADGAQGPQGPQGPQGLPGQDGADGAQGLQGPQGIPGIDGSDGPEGPTGPEGPAPTSAEISVLIEDYLTQNPSEIWFDDTDVSVTGIAGAARIDIPAFEPKTFDVDAGKVVYVEFYMPWNTHALAGGIIRGFVSDNTGADAAAVIKAQANSAKAYTTNAEVGVVIAKERLTVPGTYTRKPQVGASTASGAHGMLANAIVRPHFRIYSAVV